MKHLIIDILLAPILGLAIGSAVLFVVGYLNWGKGKKEKTIAWIQVKIFRNSLDSQSRSEGLFNVITSLLLMGGGLMIVASIFILTNVEY